MAYYGPDDKTTTKIVAGVIKEAGAEAIIKRWVATDVMTNPKVRKEVERFFKSNGVKQVGMTDGNSGCPTKKARIFLWAATVHFARGGRENREAGPKSKMPSSCDGIVTTLERC